MTERTPKVSPALVPRIVRKILVTVLVGGMSYLVTNAFISDDNDDLWSLLLATFISGVIFVVQFLVDVDAQLDALRQEQRVQHRSTHTLVADGFATIHRSGELYGLIEASAMPTDVVTRFAHNAAKAGGEDAPELVRKLVHHEVERVSRFLKELGDTGRAIYEGEDREWLLALALNTQTSLDAISLSTVDARETEFAGGFWMTDLGQRYLKIQRGLVRRGVGVRRIFIMDRSDRQESESFRRVWKWQTEIGIDVRVLADTDAPPTLRGSLSDFILFDDVIYYESNPSPQRGDGIAPMILSTIVVGDQEKVRERAERFRELWGAASPLA
ncbi:hypothetical protein [Sphaerisporangium aureirubrum]|uniref:Phosphatidylserine/phosphatidylglycerophosphate/ cardiolipin synthase family protein n=1 Tax=Sphaerisporangium aureirubrum TaxID=1544736 RepID=A0ABW1NSZ7_9ACTN